LLASIEIENQHSCVTMSDQSSYSRTAAGQSSTMHRCPVCGTGYLSLFSVQRHLGVKHMLDVDGRMITKERQAYLRHQSDRRYIRNGERKSDSQSAETGIESIRPSRQALSASRASYIEPAKQSRKLVLVEPAIIDEIYNKMKFMDYLKSGQNICEDDDADSDVMKNSVISPVRGQFQRHVETSKRVRRQPQKTTLCTTSDWSCY